MSEIPTDTPENRETLDDNARKFVVGTLDPDFLESNGATSFVLTTDWLETGADDEKKLAHKKFKDGTVQILLIAKVMMNNGKRTSVKEPIGVEKYDELVASSVLRVEKTRYEFTHEQDGVNFSVKYDEFAGSDLRILEVDADTEEERESFEPNNFPGSPEEVTGDLRYYGYRVAGVV